MNKTRRTPLLSSLILNTELSISTTYFGTGTVTTVQRAWFVPSECPELPVLYHGTIGTVGTVVLFPNAGLWLQVESNILCRPQGRRLLSYFTSSVAVEPYSAILLRILAVIFWSISDLYTAGEGQVLGRHVKREAKVKAGQEPTDTTEITVCIHLAETCAFLNSELGSIGVQVLL